MTMNLKQKSFLFVAMSAAVLLLTYVGVSRLYLRQSTDRLMAERLDHARAVAENLNEFFDRGLAKLQRVANLPGLAYGLESQNQSEGSQIPAATTLHYIFLDSDVFTLGIYMVDARGGLLWSEPPENTLFVGAPYPPFDSIRSSYRSDETERTYTVWQTGDGEARILLSAPVISEAGTPIGYIIGEIPTTHPLIEGQLIRGHTEARQVQLVSEDGVVIAGTDAHRLMRQVPHKEPVFSIAQSEPSGVLQGESIRPYGHLVAFSIVGNSPWMITTDEGEASAFADVGRQANILTAFGALFAIVAIGTLAFVVRSFTRPIEILTAEARRIGAGDVNVRFTVDRRDEIGLLASTLDDMNLRLKASYERLLQGEKMALMGQVVAGIAHELNNPLTIVIGHTELMMLRGTDERQLQQLSRVHDGAERAAKIVKSLLTFARQTRPERNLTNVNQVIQKTAELREYEMKVSNIQLVLNLGSDVPLTMTDAHQLQQVFLNLIVNAEHAMLDANGTGCLTIRSRVKEDKIIVTFSDDGPGISMDNLRRVFDPFFTTKVIGKGTGLGLSICQGIIAEHGGRLYVESIPGNGATFTVELPVVENVEPAVHPALTRGLPVPQLKRVLVVDDDTNVRELLEQILREEGHIVETAGSGADAMKLVNMHSFDLLITDIKMPDTDGMTFYEALKKTHPQLGSRVIFVTGDLMNAATLRFLDSSGSPWVGKPFEIRTLRNTISRMLRPES